MKLLRQLAFRRLSAVFVGAVMVAAAASGESASWLDLPLAGWNKPGAAIPSAPAGTESREALARRCSPTVAAKMPAAPGAALTRAGWLPYLHLDQQIQRDNVDVIGGLIAAGSDCGAKSLNIFVFVGGVFAGTLAPAPMTAARDGAIGAVRVTAPDTLTAEFARYKPTDSECCSSGRIRVTYKIERNGGPAVVATEVKTIR